MFARKWKGLFKIGSSRKVRWIVVASQAEARVFERVGNDPTLRLVTNMEHPEGRKLSHELKEGKPGRSFSSRGRHRHAMETEVSPHAQEARIFSRAIGSFLDKGRADKRYDELVLIAEPHFMGLLQDELSKETKRRVTARVHKDLVRVRADQIVAYVQDAVQAAS